MKSKLPKTIVVYISEYDRDNTPILAVADNGIKGVPEDCAEMPVGVYKLESHGNLEVSQKRDAIERLINAGQMLSNICFNLKQLPETPLAHVHSMAESQSLWDRRLQEFRELTK